VLSETKKPLVRVGTVLLAVRVIAAVALHEHILLASRLLALSDVHRAVKILVLAPLDSTVLIEVHAAEVSGQRLVNMLTFLSVDCQQFRGKGYITLRPSHLLLKFSLNLHKFTFSQPSNKRQDDRQCYCNTHEDVLNSHLIIFLQGRLYLNGVSPSGDQAKAQEESAEVKFPELVEGGGIAPCEVFSEVEVHSKLVFFQARDEYWGDELDPHYKVSQHVDERARESCPIHLSSQLIPTCCILHRHWHSKVELVVNLLLLSVVDPLVLVLLLF